MSIYDLAPMDDRDLELDTEEAEARALERLAEQDRAIAYGFAARLRDNYGEYPGMERDVLTLHGYIVLARSAESRACSKDSAESLAHSYRTLIRYASKAMHQINKIAYRLAPEDPSRSDRSARIDRLQRELSGIVGWTYPKG